MEENLVQISQTLQSLSNTSALDWFSVIAPILLSVVAICISISTARKQNKIALFEKQWNLYGIFVTMHLLLRTYFYASQKCNEIKATTIINCNNNIAIHKGFTDYYQLSSHIDSSMEKMPILFNVKKLIGYDIAYKKFDALSEYISDQKFKDEVFETDSKLIELFEEFLNSESKLKETMQDVKNQINI